MSQLPTRGEPEMADEPLSELDHEGIEVEPRFARVGAEFEDELDRAVLGLVELVREGTPRGVALEVPGSGNSCEAGAALMP